MSEEKLYALKDNFDNWADADYKFGQEAWETPNKAKCKEVAGLFGGSIITLIEEPEKVVLTKKQAEIVEDARASDVPATYISERTPSYDEELIMNACVNGYTVAKEKKYNVKVPKKWSGDDKHYWTKEQDGTLTWACLISKDYMIPTQQFTSEEIKKWYLDGFEKVEVEENGGLDK